jgi:TRAP-type C4-dicarboxylate transport system permease small subunit
MSAVPRTSHAAPTATAPTALDFVDRVVGKVTAGAMGLSALSVLASLCIIVYGVVMRYVFNSPPTWVDDSVSFLLVGTVMLAAPATLRRGGHISVDMLTERLRGGPRRIAEAWSTLAVGLVCAILIANGWETAMSSRELGILTSGNVEIPIWQLQLLLPVGGVLMLLVSIESLIRIACRAPSLALEAHQHKEAE